MTLRERLSAEESKIGKWVKNWIGKLLLACSALGAAFDYLNLVPADWIPTWLKTSVVIAGVVGLVGGKLTVKKPETPVVDGKV